MVQIYRSGYAPEETKNLNCRRDKERVAKIVQNQSY